jgi:transposase
MTYSIDFRKKVLKLKAEENLSYEAAAERFKIGKTTLVRWHTKLEPQLTRNKPATKINMEALKQDVEKYPDGYQYERANRLGVSQKGIFEALKRLGVTYKKNSKASKSGSRKTIYVLPTGEQTSER